MALKTIIVGRTRPDGAFDAAKSRRRTRVGRDSVFRMLRRKVRDVQLDDAANVVLSDYANGKHDGRTTSNAQVDRISFALFFAQHAQNTAITDKLVGFSTSRSCVTFVRKLTMRGLKNNLKKSFYTFCQ